MVHLIARDVEYNEEMKEESVATKKSDFRRWKM